MRRAAGLWDLAGRLFETGLLESSQKEVCGQVDGGGVRVVEREEDEGARRGSRSRDAAVGDALTPSPAPRGRRRPESLILINCGRVQIPPALFSELRNHPESNSLPRNRNPDAGYRDV